MWALQSETFNLPEMKGLMSSRAVVLARLLESRSQMRGQLRFSSPTLASAQEALGFSDLERGHGTGNGSDIDYQEKIMIARERSFRFHIALLAIVQVLPQHV